VGVVQFIVEDKPFREAFARYPQIVCHSDIYTFCSHQRLNLDVSAEKELQKRSLPMQELQASATKMLKNKLPGLTLRLPIEAATDVEKVSIEIVREVRSCAFEANSVIHLQADDYLVAFNAAIVAQCQVPPE